MYITDYLDVFVIIALGNQRFTYIDKRIIYIPIYLIKDEEIKDQIGVYEFVGSQLYNLLDNKDEFDCPKKISVIGNGGDKADVGKMSVL